jgi:predicted nucleic acid-binding protein
MSGWIIIDSSIWFDVLRHPRCPHTPVVHELIADGSARVTGLVRAEILPFARPGRNRRYAEELLSAIPALDIEPAARQWHRVTELRTRLVRAGLGGIALPDVVIAAIALDHEAAIWSLDGRFTDMSEPLSLRLFAP